MFYPKTGELETFWTNYTCTEDDCPGVKRTAKRMSHSARAGNPDPERTNTPEGMQLGPGEAHLGYSPGYW